MATAASWPATDEIDLTTVGIDVGSSTSHLMFARVTLRREPGGLSSRFVVTQRQTLWRSPILLTPYTADNTIDEQALRAFIDEQYDAAHMDPRGIDSGAVILTGVALLRDNARAITDVLAEHAGALVCASAGHELEARLAAHGSGAAALSRRDDCAVLNIDVGGGTTKFAYVEGGEIVDTAALSVGGRLVSWDRQRTIVQLEPAGAAIARELGVDLEVGATIGPDLERALARRMADVIVAMLAGGPLDRGLDEFVLLSARRPGWVPDRLTFSGGVSSAVLGDTVDHGDLGRQLGAELANALAAHASAPSIEASGAGIRATVIGASQFSVQVSGDTLYVSDAAALPCRNLPVIRPTVDASTSCSAAIADDIRDTLERLDPDGDGPPCGLALSWPALPEYNRLRALADGVAAGFRQRTERGDPLIVISDADVAQTLGRILDRELRAAPAIVCIDGLRLEAFDYVDIGERRAWPAAVPVVIKSLIFPAAEPAVGLTSTARSHP